MKRTPYPRITAADRITGVDFAGRFGLRPADRASDAIAAARAELRESIARLVETASVNYAAFTFDRVSDAETRRVLDRLAHDMVPMITAALVEAIAAEIRSDPADLDASGGT
jgi:hypothetical protein